ncbi:hypothetical protein FB451DRAFT_1429898 [Mycena latifolia]|nr:hypothetical protein FB451DRAFT_1429898 [Mycena latifolia]
MQIAVVLAPSEENASPVGPRTVDSTATGLSVSVSERMLVKRGIRETVRTQGVYTSRYFTGASNSSHPLRSVDPTSTLLREGANRAGGLISLAGLNTFAVLVCARRVRHAPEFGCSCRKVGSHLCVRVRRVSAPAHLSTLLLAQTVAFSVCLTRGLRYVYRLRRAPRDRAAKAPRSRPRAASFCIDYTARCQTSLGKNPLWPAAVVLGSISFSSP